MATSGNKLIIKTEIDNSDLPKNLKEAEKYIKNLTKDFENQVKAITEQETALGRLKEKLAEETQFNVELGDLGELDTAKTTALKEEIGQLENNLSLSKDKANDLKNKIYEVSDIKFDSTERSVNKLSKSFDKFRKRIMRIAGAVLIFNALRKAFTAFKNYLVSGMKDNDAYVNSIAQIKGAFLTAIEPLRQTLVPVIVQFVQWIAKAIQFLAVFTNLLFGKSVKASSASAKALHKQTQETKALKKATDSVNNSLDEFSGANKQDSSDNSSSASAPITPDFEIPQDIIDKAEAFYGWLQKWYPLLLLIAIALGVMFAPWLTAIALAIYLGYEIIKNWENIKKWFSDFLKWFETKWTNLFGSGVIDSVKSMWQNVKRIFTGLKDFIVGIFTGDIKKAINGLANVFAGVLNLIIGKFELLMNFALTPINALIKGFNSTLGKVPGVPTIDPVKVTLPKIPKFASGVVLPGGAPMLGILNDQPRGQTMIETQLATMKQAFREAQVESGGMNTNLIPYLEAITTAINNLYLSASIDNQGLLAAVEGAEATRGYQTGNGVFKNAR